MKTRNLIKLILVCLPAITAASERAYGQTPDRETLARQVDDYVRETGEAAARFLNDNFAPEARLKMIEPYSIIYDEKQIDQFRARALDPEESAEIRAAAISRIARYAIGDERIEAEVNNWLENPRTPIVLRRAALRIEEDRTFVGGNIRDVYQKLLDDPEIDFRIFAFTQLIIHGDARAQQLFIQGLEDPKSARMPAPLAIGILNMAVKKEYFPAVYRLLQETKDPAIRLEATRALGAYMPARQTLIAMSRDAGEKPEFREAALGALYAGDAENIVRYVAPIVRDREAPARLRAIGIQMTVDVRQKSKYRFEHQKADEYDEAIRDLVREERDGELKRVAENYLSAVRPRF